MSSEREFLDGTMRLLGDLVLTEEQKNLRRDIEDLELKMQDRQRMNFTKDENKQFFDDRMLEIQSKHYESNQAVVEKIDRALERLKEKHFKEQGKRTDESLLEIQRYELRYGSLSAESLRQEAGRFIQEQPPWSADRLYSLAKHLSARGVKEIYASKTGDAEGDKPIEHRPFSEWLADLDAEAVWERTPEGKQLKLLRKVYGSPFGTSRFMYIDGRIESKPLEIKKMYREGK